MLACPPTYLTIYQFVFFFLASNHIRICLPISLYFTMHLYLFTYLHFLYHPFLNSTYLFIYWSLSIYLLYLFFYSSFFLGWMVINLFAIKSPAFFALFSAFRVTWCGYFLPFWRPSFMVRCLADWVAALLPSHWLITRTATERKREMCTF